MSTDREKVGPDDGQCSIERKERLITGRSPDQISPAKQPLGQPTEEKSASENHDPRVQRSEITVEMKGIRETALSCSDSVVSSRVRTVYDRTSSSGGSTSSVSSVSSLDPCLAGPLEDGDDSAFSPGDAQPHRVNDGAVRARGLSSDSYYISQTYQISSPSSPRAVSAVSGVASPRFKTCRNISVGSDGGRSVEENNEFQFVDRREGELPNTPHRPLKVPSQEKKVHFQGVEDTEEPDDQLSEKMKSARENVQQMIESSYMVSDITDVIDQTMGSTEDATTVLNATEGSTATKPLNNLPDLVSSAGQFSSLDVPGKGPDRPLSPVLAYSPGAAIRSYAMEELAERKSRNNTPDRTWEKADQPAPPVKRPLAFRFGPDSGLDDEGSSVDAFVSETSEMTSSQPEASLTLQASTAAAPLYTPYSLIAPVATSEEEAAEALDKLVDLESIQAGYRFHDVGIMLSAEEDDQGGICNPAFDDSDGLDDPPGFSSEDMTSSQVASQASVYCPTNHPASFMENAMSSSVPPRTFGKPPASVEDSSSYKEAPIVSQHMAGLSQNSSLGLGSGTVLSRPAAPMDSTEQKQLLSSCQPDATTSRNPLPSSLTTCASAAPLTQTCPAAKTKSRDYPAVSVSRRFNIRDKKFEAALRAKGAVLRSESVSYDIYYDTPDATLTLSDAWLRSQNGRWQMSANFTKLFNTETEHQFLETDEDSRIIRSLSALLGSGKRGKLAASRLDGVDSEDSVSRLVHLEGLQEFGRSASTRREYSLGGQSGELTVELLLSDLGFWTGQVTATVAGARDGLTQALASIDSLWRDTASSHRKPV
ncbi:hypothetical protein EGW08_000488 [Elysia chlorotica]|uniref:CYTH domain-containing protein n=1 Tax=Elysia chlorotica TaxID=188477 RepID=A0A3S1A1W8_ELYCH|nr:hypothetical protein EGW08_000488 [Elysia chlorotica]